VFGSALQRELQLVAQRVRFLREGQDRFAFEDRGVRGRRHRRGPVVREHVGERERRAGETCELAAERERGVVVVA